MIARAHGDHIHSSRTDGGPDRCHGRPGCHPQLMGLDFLVDDARMRQEAMSRLGVWLNLPPELSPPAPARDASLWVAEKMQQIADDLTRKFGLDEQGLYLTYDAETIPILRDTD